MSLRSSYNYRTRLPWHIYLCVRCSGNATVAASRHFRSPLITPLQINSPGIIEFLSPATQWQNPLSRTLHNPKEISAIRYKTRTQARHFSTHKILTTQSRVINLMEKERQREIKNARAVNNTSYNVNDEWKNRAIFLFRCDRDVTRTVAGELNRFLIKINSHL